MSSFEDRLEQQLRLASVRQIARPQNRILRRLRSPFAALALTVAVAAPAAAIVAGWDPQIGGGSGSHPTSSSNPPPPAQLQAFGVLRRAQTEEDRGSAAASALRLFPLNLSGVRLAYSRVVHVGGGAPPLEIAPVDSYSTNNTHGTDGLCVFAADLAGPHGTTAGGGFSCFSQDQATTGKAIFAIGQHVYGLAPDDVEKVTVKYPGYPSITSTPHDNVYAYDAPGALPPLGWPRTWHLKNGQSVALKEEVPPPATGEPKRDPKSG